MDGALLTDKPAGMTSAAVVGRLKYLLKPGKIGHAGTLDPMATGLLVVLFGKATRLQSIFLESDKAYQGVIKLGVKTDSDDITGGVLELDSNYSRTNKCLESDLEKITIDFSGELLQMPPAISALKVKGERSYKIARRGEKPDLVARKVFVRHLKLEWLDSERIGFSTTVSKGTYIRSLAVDIAKALGTCGCLEELRRTASGKFGIENAFPLDELDRSNVLDKIIPLETLVADLPSFTLAEVECVTLKKGDQRVLSRLKMPEQGRLAAIFNGQRNFQGLLELGDSAAWRVKFLV